MADLAYTIAGNVLDKLGSLAYEEVSLAWGMKDDLNKLKLITLALQEVLPDAETKQEERPTLKTWVVELKDTFHDAVDVLDEFECELLRRKVVKQYASFCRKVHRFFSHSNPIVYCFSVAHRVREIRERLDEIDKNMEKFQLIKIAPNVDQSVRETHSFVNLLDVIGRDCEKGEILDMNKEELEEIGESCCVDLCNRSFFQADHGEDYFGLNQEFRVHDLIHNLACSITQNECSIVNSNDDRMISDKVRYLRIVINEINLTKLSKLKKLKSIHVNSAKDEKDEVVQLFLSTCISTFKHLRVFDLSKLSVEVLPSSIGTMKQLRYLNLRENEKIKRLPNSICKLQSLQTLILDGCVELEEIPDDIGSLVSLRTLMLTTKQSFLCYGSLKSLRFLYINSCDNLKVLSNDSINCTTLRTLAIGDCAKLNLASEFSSKNVQLSLQTFVIFSLPETTDLPQWLEQAAKTLRNLRIEDCSKLTRLPEWLPKLISLEKLEIICCRNLLSLPDGMEGLTSLTHLVIENCIALKERCKREVGPDWHKIAHVPNLSIG
ncbi:hypothetical protein CsatB_016335 [Cannabis sativa]